MNGDLISRKAVIDALTSLHTHVGMELGARVDFDEACDAICKIPAVEAEITGDTSDGYHTFNELYHHRAVLFSVIVKAFSDSAWKSKLHHDGTMYDGMFIVGIDTPDGAATYHYDINPYWDMFACKEIECAPEWDGHTPAQAIERISKLEPARHGHWIWHEGEFQYECSACKMRFDYDKTYELFDHGFQTANYCPYCGARMDGGAQDE